jgi:cytochrome P450
MSTSGSSSRATPPGEDEQVVRELFRRLRSPEGLADPYAIYRELRDRESRGGSIGRVIVRHDQAIEVLSDRSVSSERIEALVSRLEPQVREEVAEVTATLEAIVAFRDPPGHTRVRRLLAQALRARAVSRQREVIERAANRLLDELVAGGSADIHGAFTYPLPAMVVAGILGIPEADRRRFERWANDIVFFVGSGALNEKLARATLLSVREMRAYMSELVAARRADPQDDLFTAMIEAEDEGTLTDEEIHANALFLMTAGHETATNMLSNGILTLLRHPEQFALLREQPDLIGAATEEILRFESPVQMTPRLAKEDTVLAGREVAAGDPVVIVLGAANRDPDVFSEPDEFRLDRTDQKHIAFAHGAHWCIGGPLAREEARIVLPLVLERLPDLQLADETIDWQPTLNFRGPTRLEVRWQ